MQHDPDRLRPHLELADRREAVRDYGQDGQRADQIANRLRNAEARFQRFRHDRGLDGEEDECEARVDERGDGRAEIAEAGAARQEVDVHAVTRGVIADRQACQKDQEADRQDGQRRIGETIGQRHRSADRLEREEGRGGDRRVADAYRRPATRLLGGESQRVVLERLVRHPLVVVPASSDDPLWRIHVARFPAAKALVASYCNAIMRLPRANASIKLRASCAPNTPGAPGICISAAHLIMISE